MAGAASPAGKRRARFELWGAPRRIALDQVSGCNGSHIANAEVFAFPPDDLAVARLADPRFEDEFFRTRQDIVGPQQGAGVGRIEDQATHRAIATAKDNKRGSQHATS